MQVLHAVTLVSADGAFGGPVRVAENQLAALRQRGHGVSVVSTHRGYAVPPHELGGAPARLFKAVQAVPGAGFSGLGSLRALQWTRTALGAVDLVHIHLARDLVTLPIALLALRRGVPYVLQPHGMVMPSNHVLSAPLDALTTRAVLAGAAAVLHLTEDERDGLTRVAGRPLALQQFGNGVPVAGPPPALPEIPEVLFCARLQERKRPLAFTAMARRLLSEGVRASFVLVGPDEGLGAAVLEDVAAVGDRARLRWEGPLSPALTLARMSLSSVLVLPSVNEPYPMSVLEAMSAGRPVVVTRSCGLADAVWRHDCGLVVDESQAGLEDAVRALLSDPVRVAALGRAAAETAARHFSMSAVVTRLEEVYAGAVRSPAT